MQRARTIALKELGEVGRRDRLLLKREMLVGAEIVNPELLGLHLRRAWPLVEEADVGLHAGLVEDPGWEAEERVHVAGLEELSASGLAGPALEEDVVRKDDSGAAAVGLEQGVDVLDEVELFVRGADPEIITDGHLLFPLQVALLIHGHRASLFPKRRIGGHHRKGAV